MTVEPLHLHRDQISAAEVDLTDPYVSANLTFYITHNVLRRNLASCTAHAQSLATANFETFLFYTRYTLHALEDHLNALDTIWFPVFAEWDPRFWDMMDAHKSLRKGILLLQSLLETTPALLPSALPKIAEDLGILQERVLPQFDAEEELVNETARQIPLARVKVMQEKQEEQRKDAAKVHGHLWMTYYLMRGLSPREREVFSLNIPPKILDAMMTTGTLQFRRESRFMPTF